MEGCGTAPLRSMYACVLLALLLGLLYFSLPATHALTTTPYVSKLAGSMTWSKNGELRSSRYTWPSEVTFVMDGGTHYLYYAGEVEEVVRRINLDTFTVETIAGTGETGWQDGPGVQAKFARPFGTAWNPNSKVLYVVDAENQRIRTINMSSPVYDVSTLAGTGSRGFTNGHRNIATFTDPFNLVYDSTRNRIYISDNGNSIIRRIDLNTDIVSTLCGQPRTYEHSDGACQAAKLYWPIDLSLDSANNALFFVDAGSYVIRRIDLTAETVETIAGTVNSQGFLNGPATTAKFSQAWGLTVNNDGSLVYVADTINNCIRLIDRTTIPAQVSTVTGTCGSPNSASDGDSTQARFAIPMGMTIDPSDNRNIYFSDRNSFRIRHLFVQPVSTLTTTLNGGDYLDGRHSGFHYINVTQNSSLAEPQFSEPSGIAIDPVSGGIYLADMNNHAIRVVHPDDQIVETLSGGGGYFGNSNGGFSVASYNLPTGVAVDPVGNSVYVADRYNHCIRKLDRNTKIVSTFAGTCGSAGTFILPYSVTVDANGASVLVANTYADKIMRVIISDGTVSTVAGTTTGSTDGPVASAKFFDPYHVCVDSQSNIYVADYSNHKIRKVAGSMVSTVAGTGTSGYENGANLNSKFTNPSSVHCDESSGQLKLWVADSGNHVIRLISGGSVTTVAGRNPGDNLLIPGYANAVYSQALFRTPISVALDPISQILYASDNDNTRIRTFGRPYLKPTPTVSLSSSASTITLEGRGFCNTDCSLNAVSFSQWAGTLYCAHIVSCSYSKITCELGGDAVPGALNASISVSQFSCPVVGDSNLEAVADAMPRHSISTTSKLLAQNAFFVHIHGQKFLDLDLQYYAVYLNSGTCSIISIINGSTIVCKLDAAPQLGPLNAIVKIGSGNSTEQQVATIVPPPLIFESEVKIAANAVSITISGSDFGALPEDNTIYLTLEGVSPNPTCTVVEASNMHILCTNLTGLSTSGTGRLSAVVMSYGGNSSSLQIGFVVPAPIITPNTDEIFLSAESVLIHGTGFSPNASENEVSLYQETGPLPCFVNSSTETIIECIPEQPLQTGPLLAIVFVHMGFTAKVQVATVVPDIVSTSSNGHSSVASSASTASSSYEASSQAKSSVTSSGASVASEEPTPASILPFVAVSLGLFILILLIIILVVVIIVVLVVLLVLTKREKRNSNTDAIELLDSTTAPTMSVIPTSDLLWEFEDPEEEEEKEGRMQQKELSHISKRVKLTTEERNKADELVRVFAANKKLPYIDIRGENMIRMISIALVLLENVDSRACGSELTCFIWESFLTDQQRLDGLRKYKLLFSLLQACVHLSEPSDWSFVERLQHTMQSYNKQLAESHYTLHDEIGSGAFGSVYIAHRQGAPQSERVAIKVIKFAKKGYDEHSTEQLISLRKIKREIVIMSILAMDNNPWLIHFMGHQLEPMKVSIIMAMAKGNVKDVLAANRRLRKNNANSSASGSESASSSSSSVLLPFSSRLDIAIQVASALQYLHSFSIVHRDLKSENILVMNRISMDNLRASVRLIDFGISRTTSEAESTFVTGTISWMAPEILETGESGNKKVELTTQCDVYSFGYLLWTLLTEREPHSSYAHSIESVKRAVIANSDCPLAIPPPQQVPDFAASTMASSNTALPVSMYDSYCRLLMACWRTAPNKRPTMTSVLDELRKIQAQLAQ